MKSTRVFSLEDPFWLNSTLDIKMLSVFLFITCFLQFNLSKAVKWPVGFEKESESPDLFVDRFLYLGYSQLLKKDYRTSLISQYQKLFSSIVDKREVFFVLSLSFQCSILVIFVLLWFSIICQKLFLSESIFLCGHE